MQTKPDYYALLGVLRDATPEEIKRAYLQAAQRLHPDKNKAVGETELFLGVQQAYETLSNPKRRAEYDATLPPAPPPGPVRATMLFSRNALPRASEPQLVYALLKAGAAVEMTAPPAPPLNVCLVIDRSTSMQGIKMDTVKATAVQIMRSLRPQDVLGVVAFSDRAEVVVPSALHSERMKLAQRIQMLQTGGATEILQGLQVGLEETRRNLDERRINHIILLTDGHTYGDEAGCLKLAEEAATYGIGISGLGIGEKWNDRFLDELAVRTGGSSMYISGPKEIERLLGGKFRALARAFVDESVLEFRALPGVQISYAFRLQPEAGLLPVEAPMRLGPILHDTPLVLLIEFLVHPSALDATSVTLLDGSLRITLPDHPVPPAPIRLILTREISARPAADPPPTELLNALSRMSLYRMQEKARAEVEAGQYERASRRLDSLAGHLLTQGQRSLAQTALLEAQHIRSTQALSEEGLKSIKYGTRALLDPAAGEKK